MGELTDQLHNGGPGVLTRDALPPGTREQLDNLMSIPAYRVLFALQGIVQRALTAAEGIQGRDALEWAKVYHHAHKWWDDGQQEDFLDEAQARTILMWYGHGESFFPVVISDLMRKTTLADRRTHLDAVAVLHAVASTPPG